MPGAPIVACLLLVAMPCFTTSDGLQREGRVHEDMRFICARCFRAFTRVSHYADSVSKASCRRTDAIRRTAAVWVESTLANEIYTLQDRPT